MGLKFDKTRPEIPQFVSKVLILQRNKKKINKNSKKLLNSFKKIKNSKKKKDSVSRCSIKEIPSTNRNLLVETEKIFLAHVFTHFANPAFEVSIANSHKNS